ncbi:hypothetical protein [Agrococcus sp. ARC_14]|uniref:hypothetical protein n=1 Tax=Agrococcus sp. ARC_14 TaxID=2919927 RepID=UPI001F05964C|nr:hypothetical protein [Agrococcus sp. ARC_14]MCH1884396.1 hypothetical protein [Agrococcus sp. ARC_14]
MTRIRLEATPPEPPRRWSDSAGEWALVLGVIAVACVFVPVIGDWITLPFALGAVLLGFVGIRGAAHGRARRSIMAMLGILLGAGSLGAVLVLLMATSHSG